MIGVIGISIAFIEKPWFQLHIKMYYYLEYAQLHTPTHPPTHTNCFFSISSWLLFFSSYKISEMQFFFGALLFQYGATVAIQLRCVYILFILMNSIIFNFMHITIYHLLLVPCSPHAQYRSVVHVHNAFSFVVFILL